MLPNGWTNTNIRSLLADASPGYWGGSPTGHSDVAVIRSTNFTKDGRLRLDDIAYRHFEERKIEQKQLKYGDIILERSGGSPIQPVGRVVIFDIKDQLYSCTNFMQRLTIDKDKALPLFVYYLLWDLYQSGATSAMQKATTGIRNLDYNQYLDTRIIVPPIFEQEKIAEVLLSIDHTIQITQAVIEQTKTVKEELLYSLFSNGVDNTDFKKTEIGKIPKHWKVLSIGDVLSSSAYGLNKSLSADPVGFAILRMGNIQDGRLDLSSLKYAQLDKIEQARYDLKIGDILFNRTNSPDLVGKVAIIDEPVKDVSFASYLIRLRVNPTKAVDRWLFYYLYSTAMQKRLKDIATLGVSQANINPTKMKALKIAVPDKEEQTEIVRQIDAFQKQLDQDKIILSQLKKIKAGLMSDLLSGRVRVNAVSEMPKVAQKKAKKRVAA